MLRHGDGVRFAESEGTAKKGAAGDDGKRVIEVAGLSDVVERGQLLGAREEVDGIAAASTPLARASSASCRRAVLSVRTRLR